MSKPPESDALELEESSGKSRDHAAVPPLRETVANSSTLPLKAYLRADRSHRPVKTSILVGLAFVLWLFFAVFALLFFSYGGMEPTSTILVGTVMWLMVLLGWTSLVGGRKYWMSESSPVDWVARALFRRTEPVPKVDDAPAQLLRRRGKPREALRLYEGWHGKDPSQPILLYRMAEIEQEDLKNLPRAQGLYRRFQAAVNERGSAATEEEQQLAAYTQVLLKEIEATARRAERGPAAEIEPST